VIGQSATVNPQLIESKLHCSDLYYYYRNDWVYKRNGVSARRRMCSRN